MSQANQTIVLYKRHKSTGKVHKSRLPYAARRSWMECDCPIWIVGRTPQEVEENGTIVLRELERFTNELTLVFASGETAILR